MGTAGARLALKADWSGPVFGLQLGGSELRLDGLRLDSGRDAGTKASPIIALDHATVAIRLIDLAARNAELSSISIEGLTVNGERASDGSVNLLKLAKSGGSTPAAPTTRKQKAAPAEPAWKYSIDSIDLGKSGLAFTDRSQQ